MFQALPGERWAAKILRDNPDTDRAEFRFSDDEWSQFDGAIREVTGMSAAQVKTGEHPGFQQATQKERILAALNLVAQADWIDER